MNAFKQQFYHKTRSTSSSRFSLSVFSTPFSFFFPTRRRQSSTSAATRRWVLLSIPSVGGKCTVVMVERRNQLRRVHLHYLTGNSLKFSERRQPAKKYKKNLPDQKKPPEHNAPEALLEIKVAD